jgi:hypothetical protein
MAFMSIMWAPYGLNTLPYQLGKGGGFGKGGFA